MRLKATFKCSLENRQQDRIAVNGRQASGGHLSTVALDPLL